MTRLVTTVVWIAPAFLAWLFVGGCAARTRGSIPEFPRHWWSPAPREGAPGWEILPQEAGRGEVILSKRNEILTMIRGELIIQPR